MPIFEPIPIAASSILTKITRAIAVIILGLLIAGDASLSYGQDAETRNYVVVDAQSNSMDIPGQGQQEMNITTTVGYSVTKTGDRSYSVTVTNLSIEGSPAGNMGQDALIGTESDIVLAADGSVESISGMEENEGVVAIGGEAVFKDRIQALFLRGPEGDVSIGKEWSVASSIPTNQQGMSVERNIISNYHCVGDEEIDGVAVWVIDVSAAVDLTGSGNAGGQEMEMEMSGDITGKIYVEKDTGMVLSSEADGEMEGMIDMEAFSILMFVGVHNTISSTAG